MKGIYCFTIALLLSACAQPSPEHGEVSPILTVRLQGVPSAEVSVIDANTQIQLFSGVIDQEKTLTGLAANTTLQIQGQDFNGHYVTMNAQTVTMSTDQSITVPYAKTPQKPAESAPAYNLTVTLQGIDAAPIQIVNLTDQQTLFKGVIQKSQVFSNIKEGTVLRVTGERVDNLITMHRNAFPVLRDKKYTVKYKPLPKKGETAAFLDATGTWQISVKPVAATSWRSLGTVQFVQALDGELSGLSSIESFDDALTGDVNTGDLWIGAETDEFSTAIRMTGTFTATSYQGTARTTYRGDVLDTMDVKMTR